MILGVDVSAAGTLCAATNSMEPLTVMARGWGGHAFLVLDLELWCVLHFSVSMCWAFILCHPDYGRGGSFPGGPVRLQGFDQHF